MDLHVTSDVLEENLFDILKKKVLEREEKRKKRGKKG